MKLQFYRIFTPWIWKVLNRNLDVIGKEQLCIADSTIGTPLLPDCFVTTTVIWRKDDQLTLAFTKEARCVR